MAYIDIIDSTGNNYRYALPADGSVLLIGSGEDCSISLPHIEGLQPRHCTVSLQAEGYVIAAAVEEASLLAESQPTTAAVLVPHAVYNIGTAVLMYDEAETAPAPAEEMPQEEEEAPQEEAPVRKKKKKVRHNSAEPLMNTPMFTEEEGVLHIILRRLYVIAIIALSFLAGLTFRYWMTTGEYLIDELLK